MSLAHAGLMIVSLPIVRLRQVLLLVGRYIPRPLGMCDPNPRLQPGVLAHHDVLRACALPAPGPSSFECSVVLGPSCSHLCQSIIGWCRKQGIWVTDARRPKASTSPRRPPNRGEHGDLPLTAGHNPRLPCSLHILGCPGESNGVGDVYSACSSSSVKSESAKAAWISASALSASRFFGRTTTPSWVSASSRRSPTCKPSTSQTSGGSVSRRPDRRVTPMLLALSRSADAGSLLQVEILALRAGSAVVDVSPGLAARIDTRAAAAYTTAAWSVQTMPGGVP